MEAAMTITTPTIRPSDHLELRQHIVDQMSAICASDPDWLMDHYAANVLPQLVSEAADSPLRLVA